MKKYFKIITMLFLIVMLSASCQGKTDKITKTDENITTASLSNDLFSVQVPQRFEGLYDTKVNDHTIDFYDKECIDNGNPGWIFGIQAFENPDDWANGPVMKVGELKLNNGKLYDVVFSFPTESQFGFNEDGSQVPMPEKYKNFLDAKEEIVKTLTAKTGETVNISAGTKGEDLYKEELNKHITAIKENWDATKLEEENMSNMYAQMAFGDENVLDKVGFAYRDINMDGIDELLIGEIADGNWAGIIYDIYTMVNRKPEHVVSGWDRNRFYDYNDSFIINKASGGADENDTLLYTLAGNSTELILQFGFKYDGYKDQEKPWFKTYEKNGDDYDWFAITEEEYNDIQERYSHHIDPKYKALSTLK